MSTLGVNSGGRADGAWGAGEVDYGAEKYGLAEMTGDA